MTNSGPDKRRDHLANERTFLSWLRTSIGIMAFGFVVVRFAFFAEPLERDIAYAPQRFSALAGIALIAVGILLSAFAFFRFRAEAGRIEMEIETPASFSTILFSTLLVCSLGFLLIIYCISMLI